MEIWFVISENKLIQLTCITDELFLLLTVFSLLLCLMLWLMTCFCTGIWAEEMCEPVECLRTTFAWPEITKEYMGWMLIEFWSYLYQWFLSQGRQMVFVW